MRTRTHIIRKHPKKNKCLQQKNHLLPPTPWRRTPQPRTQRTPDQKRHKQKRRHTQTPTPLTLSQKPQPVQTQQHHKQRQNQHMRIRPHTPQRYRSQHQNPPQTKRHQPVQQIRPSQTSKIDQIARIIDQRWHAKVKIVRVPRTKKATGIYPSLRTGNNKITKDCKLTKDIYEVDA